MYIIINLLSFLSFKTTFFADKPETGQVTLNYNWITLFLH
jgi:hypothetical protein